MMNAEGRTMKRRTTFLALVCATCLLGGQGAQSQSLGHVGIETGLTTSSLVGREDGLKVSPGFLVSVSARTHTTGGLHVELGIVQRAIRFDGGIWEGEAEPMPAMTIRSTYAFGATLLRIGQSFGQATPYFLAGPRANFNLSGDDSSRPTAVIGLTAGMGVVVDGVLPIKTSAGFRFNQDLTSINTLFNIRYRILEFRVGIEL